ncbi:MAG: MEDS domain-containing protein, partial [bacterium]
IKGGWFDPDRMRQFWSDRAAEAVSRRTRHVRAVAEMAWALRALPGTDEAPLFESSLNPHLRPLPMSVICQYGSTRFSAEILLAMVLSHPLIMIGETVHHNPFFVDHDRFPERFAAARTNLAGALVPIWMHFLARQGSVANLATFLCNSLPTLIAADRVWVALDGLPHPLALDVESDSIDPADSEVFRRKTLDRRGRLHTLWPSSDRVVGGAVQFGNLDYLGALEVTYYGNAGRLLAARRGPFTNGDTARFASMASAVGRALASLSL